MHDPVGSRHGWPRSPGSAETPALRQGAQGQEGAIEPDPIFEAIRAHRVADAQDRAALSAVMGRPSPDDRHAAEALRRAATSAAKALVTIIPTTPAGVLALATYAGDFVEAGNEWPENWDLGFFSAILRASAAARPASESDEAATGNLCNGVKIPVTQGQWVQGVSLAKSVRES